MRGWLAQMLRALLTDREDRMVFSRHDAPPGSFTEATTSLYIHIPFCRSLCAWCPYNRVLHVPELAAQYAQALHEELRRAAAHYGRLTIESIYIGGGTPVLLLAELPALLTEIRSLFAVTGPVAIEVTPADIAEDTVPRLLALGVSQVSLGVQTFRDDGLQALGRAGTGATARRAAELLRAAGFDTVNHDLMTGIPGQTADTFREDLLTSLEYAPEQVTQQPLLTFAAARRRSGRAGRLRGARPGRRELRRMDDLFRETLAGQGYEPVAIGSYRKPGCRTFSSVTRVHYLGLGVGAASYNGSLLSFNTFSVPAYIATAAHRFPTAFAMRVGTRLERVLWLHWRLYENHVSKNEYRHRYGTHVGDDFEHLLRLFHAFRFIAIDNNRHIVLNARGCRWVRRMLDALAVHDVDTIAATAHATPFPSRIAL